MLELFIFIRSGQSSEYSTNSAGRSTAHADAIMQILKMNETTVNEHLAQFPHVINCAIKCLTNYFIINTGSGITSQDTDEMVQMKKKMISFPSSSSSSSFVSFCSLCDYFT